VGYQEIGGQKTKVRKGKLVERSRKPSKRGRRTSDVKPRMEEELKTGKTRGFGRGGTYVRGGTGSTSEETS